MTLTTRLRKMELMRKGVTQREIAGACDVDESLVSHVIAGRRASGDDGRKVMAYIAKLIGAPLTEVFPQADRRQGERRTA